MLCPWLCRVAIIHAHTVYRNPVLASLSQEELAQLDALTRKLAAPAQDAPHNQIESEPAIEAVEVVESTVQPHEAP